jgi:shikimate dehydrogenase
VAGGRRLKDAPAAGEALRLALFGSPVGQSKSPRIHRLFARQARLEIRYEAIETPAGTLAAALERFAAEGGAGCNVTLPLKAEAAALARACSPAVERAGAANTLLRAEHGWRAENTDGVGLLADLRAGNLEPRGRRIALLGAGGAAAGILGALLEQPPREILIFNRTQTAAIELADRHAFLGVVSGHGLDALAGAGAFDLVLNATSAGHDGGLPPLAESLFTPDGACYDLNYGPAAAPLAAWCHEHRIPYRDGLGMLVEQAAESFRLWTGHSPDTPPVLQSLRDSTAPA